MAKFCTKCGKKLEEGKTCDCQKNKKVEEKLVETTSTQINIKESLMDCVNVFKNIFIKPVEAIKEFVCDNKFIAGIIMIVVAAISTGLYRIAELKNSSSVLDTDAFNVGKILNSALSGSSFSTEPEYFKEFLTTFATNLVEYALIVLIGYLIISKLLKGKATWKQMVTVVAISLSIILTANLVNAVLLFIDGSFMENIRSYIASFASILSTLVLYKSVKEVAGVDTNKVFMSVASMSVFATVVIDIAMKIFK